MSTCASQPHAGNKLSECSFFGAQWTNLDIDGNVLSELINI